MRMNVTMIQDTEDEDDGDHFAGHFADHSADPSDGEIVMMMGRRGIQNDALYILSGYSVTVCPKNSGGQPI